MFTKYPILSPPKYVCEPCKVNTSNKKDYNKHLATRKHQNVYAHLQEGEKNPAKKYVCECGKEYGYRQSLYVHRKKCIPPEQNTIVDSAPEFKILTGMMLEMMKSNAELQKQMLEVCKTGMGSINSHNKTFNMQVFLNEKCKDAMNIMDFVNSMTLELSDLEDVGTLGYVEGISNIIIRKLNELDIYKRPIHCSDGKREIMYVKDNNVWGKENDTNDKLRLAIKHVTYKNSSLLVPWSQKHPNCMNIQHHLNDVYVRMIGQAMGGKEEFVDSENKIMKKIAKAVLINKV